MKIRSDFVTNSSSNSFIVAWPKRPETVHDLELMTGCDESICRYIFNQTEEDQREEASKTVLDRQFNDSIDYTLSQEDRMKYWRLSGTLNQYYSKLYMDKFLTDNKDAFISCYEFEDGGSETEYACHNGEPFRKVPYILIGKH